MSKVDSDMVALARYIMGEEVPQSAIEAANPLEVLQKALNRGMIIPEAVRRAAENELNNTLPAGYTYIVQSYNGRVRIMAVKRGKNLPLISE